MLDDEAKNEEAKNVPAVIGDDGFADTDANDRLIQGTIIRCVDGHWSSKDGTTFPPNTRLIALSTTEALQLWRNQKPVETIRKEPGTPLPNVNDLNDAIPEKEWEIELDKKPRAPWVKQYLVYLLDPKDASIYTFINSTTGAKIAVERLKDKVKWMRALRGNRVLPLVKLDTKPMPTNFGMKQRPEFTVCEWRDLGGGVVGGDLPPAKPTPAIEHIGKPVKPVTTAEELNDSLPF
jgi:hypothetical protein